MYLPIVIKIVNKRFPSVTETYASADSVDSDDSVKDSPQYPIEMLYTSTTGSALLDHDIKHNVRFLIMSPCNIDYCRGHVNVARRIMKAGHISLLTLEFLIGDSADTNLAVPKSITVPITATIEFKNLRKNSFLWNFAL